MKSIRLFLCTALCLLAISCSAQRTLSEVGSMKGVTSVFVGKAMLKLAGTSMAISGDQSAIDISKIIKDLSSIEIIKCEDNGAVKKVNKKCKEILSKYPFEVITEVNNDDQNVEISGVIDNDGETINMLLISVNGNDNASYILMKGKINIETLNKALIN